MKKKSDDNLRLVQVDAVSGDYYLSIPEWIVNELSWYEDTEIHFNVDGDEIILSENQND